MVADGLGKLRSRSLKAPGRTVRKWQDLKLMKAERDGYSRGQSKPTTLIVAYPLFLEKIRVQNQNQHPKIRRLSPYSIFSHEK